MLETSIIIVEDDLRLRAVVEMYMAKAGYNNLGAFESGTAALQFLAGRAATAKIPDVAIIDIHLQDDMDGIETARQMSERYRVAVIFITGLDDQKTIDRAFCIKPMAYLLKPFTRAQLQLTITAALYQARLEKRLEETNKQLNREIEERLQLARSVDEITERERERLGQDLHDDLGQILTGLAIKAQVLKNSMAKAGVPEVATADEIVKLANQATSHVRDLSHLLFPLVLKNKGLGSALREMASYTEGHLGVACQARCESISELEGDPVLATNLYRIAQESITNAVRHGKASHIEITLLRTGDHVILRISDNGSGMKPGIGPGKGMGLQTMQYRAQLLNATLTLHHVPSGGTMVECVCPIRFTQAVVATDGGTGA